MEGMEAEVFLPFLPFFQVFNHAAGDRCLSQTWQDWADFHRADLMLPQTVASLPVGSTGVANTSLAFL